MISRKYLKDYQIAERFDENGRVKSEAIYIGGDYTLSPRTSTGDKKLILYLSVLSCLAYMGALIPISQAAHIIYVIIPFILSAIPIFMMTAASVSLYRAKEAMTRAEAEKISNRLPPCSLFTAILAGTAFLGHTITAVVVSYDKFVPGDIIFSALSLLLLIVSIIAYTKCYRIKAIKPLQNLPSEQ